MLHDGHHLVANRFYAGLNARVEYHAAMALKDRLRTLKRQAGRTEPGVAERVGRLRARGNDSRPGSATLAETLADVVGGRVIANGLVCIERHLPLSDTHGNVPLARLGEAHGSLPEARGVRSREAVFLDTETTGLSGGSGTTVFMLGMGRLRDGLLEVRQYLLASFAGEGPMFADAGNWLAGATALVSFNGKSFDLPLLVARARLLGVANPFSGFAHLDLLHPTRRAFGHRWLDCRLGTAERELLGFARVDDLPGAEAPAAWFAHLHRNDPSRLPGVARHNHWDIVSVAALLPVLADAHREPARFGADPLAVARALLKAGADESAYGLLQEAVADLREAGLLELARLHRARERWAAACAIWESLAETGCNEAIERLAKYFEHEAKEYGRALTYARRLPPSPAREHRCRRLEARLYGVEPDLLTP